ncbi:MULTISPECIES: ATP-binding cassette domain-containing protein [unclassified Sporosarcina]|uniref:ABC transporter ATP-binding protein n=1 Tax=unclassified Sporosarcina TaxID=2647733 RepID=UPI00203EEAD3|nr:MULTISPECIES: phosphate ABC transporter ATP-binding protein [unclassified Sporosarcina]
MNGEIHTSIYEPAIHLQRVSFETANMKIIDEVTGSFPKQQITVLVGPSGAGKTTLLKMCNGLLNPTGGEIYLDGKPIKEMVPTELRRRAGMVLQQTPMIEGTVYDNLALTLRLQGKELHQEEACEVLDQVGLEHHYLQHDSNSLSGGQRQKVSIARTLLNKSDILLLDEITSALDPSSLHEVEELIRSLHEIHGITVVWITHNLEQAKRMGHYVWIMMNGKVKETGEISVLNHSENPEVQSFLRGDF